MNKRSAKLPRPTVPPPQATKAAALLERAQMLRAEVEQQEDSSWRAFEELLGVLREAGEELRGGAAGGSCREGASR